MTVRFVGLAFLFAVITGCTHYKYVNTFSSDSVVKKSDDFVYEGEDLTISYNFWQGEVWFSVYNNTDRPVYLDWSKSNFILNDYSLDYWSNDVAVKSRTLSVADGKFRYGVSASLISREKPNSQIPPRSKIVIAKFKIDLVPFGANKELRKTKGTTEFEFTSDSSPLEFRNYLSYSRSANLDSLVQVDNRFWVAKTEFMKDTYFEHHYDLAYSKDKCVVTARGGLNPVGALIFVGFSSAITVFIITVVN